MSTATTAPSLLLTVLLASAVAVFVPSDVDAQLRVCNRTSEPMNIAVSYRSDGDWLTRGWFNAGAGECVTPVGGSLQQRFYYVYGETSSSTWGGQMNFCTDKELAFRYVGRPSCAGPRQVQASFAEVDTGLALEYTLDLTHNATTRAAVEDVRVTWRGSPVYEASSVIQLRNDSSSAVSFNLKCFSRSGGFSKTFPVTIAAYSVAEIGFLEGWPGNFVAGESCEAYYGGEFVWRVLEGYSRGYR